MARHLAHVKARVRQTSGSNSSISNQKLTDVFVLKMNAYPSVKFDNIILILCVKLRLSFGENHYCNRAFHSDTYSISAFRYGHYSNTAVVRNLYSNSAQEIWHHLKLVGLVEDNVEICISENE